MDSLPKPERSHFSPIDPALVVHAYLFKCKTAIRLDGLQRRLKALVEPDITKRVVEQLASTGQMQLESQKLGLTESGEKAARNLLGRDVSETWETIRDRRFPVLALGFDADAAEPRKKLATPGNLKIAIVAVGFGLPRDKALVPTDVRSELVWRVLRRAIPQVIGNGPFPPISKSNVVDRVILAGLAGVRAKSIDKAVDALAALAIDAAKTDTRSLRIRLVQIAIGQAALPRLKLKGESKETTPGGFADRVKAVARALDTPPFQGRVAIAQIYDAYGRQHPDAGSLASFKERLVTAARARKLELSRLDLPEYMERDLRERSQTVWDSNEVHFVVTEWK
jgi:hypothetical protein